MGDLMYKYETHCHTAPVSACGRADVCETVEFYQRLGYDGLFITNHFIDGNIGGDRSDSYENRIKFYYSDYEEAAEIGAKLGIKVFDAVEASYMGTDFLVYGLDKAWYLENPGIMDMPVPNRLDFFRENGGYIIQAHPFREAAYIDHIRLFPRRVDGVEIINASRTDFENEMARLYAENYGLKMTAGSDNHCGGRQLRLAGIETTTPINSVEEFIKVIRSGSFDIFTAEL